MTRFITAFVVAITCAAVPLGAAEQTKEKAKAASDKESALAPTESIWMEKKMALSRQIMEGLARGELGDVEFSARSMRTLSRIEGWARRSDTREYRRQLKHFNLATDQIVRQSQNANLDGATLAFTQMTLSCVACHKELRDKAE